MWWALVVLAAAVTALVEPLFFAFKPVPGWYPYNDAAAVVEYLLLATFTLDIIVAFHTPYVDKRT